MTKEASNNYSYKIRFRPVPHLLFNIIKLTPNGDIFGTVDDFRLNQQKGCTFEEKIEERVTYEIFDIADAFKKVWIEKEGVAQIGVLARKSPNKSVEVLFRQFEDSNQNEPHQLQAFLSIIELFDPLVTLVTNKYGFPLR